MDNHDGKQPKEEQQETSSHHLHAHFDCFSGAAGDMMLASCLDASSNPQQLLNQVIHDLQHGLPDIQHEFALSYKQVWRGGMGSIAALKVHVESVYHHEAAPVPKDGKIASTSISTNDNHHDHGHSHGQSHEHEHGHHDHSSSNNEDKNNDLSSDEHQHKHSHEHDSTVLVVEKDDSKGGDHHNHHHHSHAHSEPTKEDGESNVSNAGTTHNHQHSHEDSHEHSPEHSHDHHITSSSSSSSSKEKDDDHSHDHHHDNNNDNHNHSHEHGHSHSHDNTSAKGPLRNLPQIRTMLEQASLEYIPSKVKTLAIQTFTELAIAEAFTHGTSSPDTVHFHEVGAIDSIVDIVGTLLALHHLSVKTVSCSALPLGEGSVWTDHGQLPVPAFATMRLLVGMKTCKGPGDPSGVVTGELVTPTAAALLRVLTGVADVENARKGNSSSKGVGGDIGIEARVGRAPSFTPRAIGIGAGSKDFHKHPNIIRLILGDDLVEEKGFVIKNDFVGGGEGEGMWKMDKLTLLQANVDDITAELLSHVIDLLLKKGAIDAWVEPIVMKKGRSAHTINCLCHSNSGCTTSTTNCDSSVTHADTTGILLETIFRHTTTLGIRIQRDIERAALHRRFVEVETGFGIDDAKARYGKVRVKLGLLGEDVVSAKPEFEDCKLISEETTIPLKIISNAALTALKM